MSDLRLDQGQTILLPTESHDFDNNAESDTSNSTSACEANGFENNEALHKNRIRLHPFAAKMINVCKEIGLLFLAIFFTYAALTNDPPKVSKSPVAYPFFPKGSVVRDWYRGQISQAYELARESDISFVMFYAPWDAKSQDIRQEFELTARYMQNLVSFSAVNCWQPGSECRNQYSKVYNWPVLIAYPAHGRGVLYSGPKSAPHMMRFLNSMMKPIIRVSDPQEINLLMSSYDALIVGEVNALPGSPDFGTLYVTALRILERDPFQEVGFVVTTVGDYGSDRNFRPKLRIHMWNETMIYPSDNPWKTGPLLNWILKTLHQVTSWVSPVGTKSQQLSFYVQPGPTLVLFTPRNLLASSVDYYDLLHEVGLEYYNCHNKIGYKPLLLRLARLGNYYKYKYLMNNCPKKQEERSKFSTVVTYASPNCWRNNSCTMTDEKSREAENAKTVEGEESYSACSVASFLEDRLPKKCNRFKKDRDFIQILEKAKVLHGPKTFNIECDENKGDGNKGDGNQVDGNQGDGNKGDGNQDDGNKRDGNRDNENKDGENKDGENKDDVNKGKKKYDSKVHNNEYKGHNNEYKEHNHKYKEHTNLEYQGLKEIYKTSMLTGENDPRSPNNLLRIWQETECRLFQIAEKTHPHAFSPTILSTRLPSDFGNSSPNITGLSCKYNTSVTIIALDSLKYFQFAEKFGIDLAKRKDKTAALIINEKMESHYVLKKSVTDTSLRQFVYDFAENNLPRAFHSSSTRLRNTHVYSEYKGAKSDVDFYIRELTSESFLTSISDYNKAVVVLYHSKQCSFCNGISYTFLMAAKALSLVDSIHFARIDGDLNSLPWEYTMERYPTVLFFPARRKSESRAFPQNIPITVPNLISFILTNLDSSLKLHAMWSLCHKTKFNEDKETCILSLRAEILTVIEGTLKEWRNADVRTKAEILFKLRQLKHLHLLVAHSPHKVALIQKYMKKLHVRPYSHSSHSHSSKSYSSNSYSSNSYSSNSYSPKTVPRDSSSKDAHLQDFQYRGSDYQDSIYRDSNYQDSNYQDSNYQDSKYQDSKYQDSKYQDSNYQDSNYKDSNYKDSNYKDSNYQDSNYQDSNYEDFDLQGSDSRHSSSQSRISERRSKIHNTKEEL